MSGLYYAFIPDRVDLSALMRCQTHSLGNRRALSIPLPSLPSAIFTFPPQPLTSPLHVCSFHPALTGSYRPVTRRRLNSGPVPRRTRAPARAFSLSVLQHDWEKEEEETRQEDLTYASATRSTGRSHQYGNVPSRPCTSPAFFSPPVLPLRQHFLASFSRIGSCSPQQWPSA